LSRGSLRSRRPGVEFMDQGPMLGFLKKFRKKHRNLRKVDHSIVFLETPFFNQKLQKIMIITSTPDAVVIYG
jgi:hypothetical protein